MTDTRKRISAELMAALMTVQEGDLEPALRSFRKSYQRCVEMGYSGRAEWYRQMIGLVETESHGWRDGSKRALDAMDGLWAATDALPEDLRREIAGSLKRAWAGNRGPRALERMWAAIIKIFDATLQEQGD